MSSGGFASAYPPMEAATQVRIINEIANYAATLIDAILITRYSGTESVLTVPASLNGSPVTVIGESAFAGCYGLVSVTLPEQLTVLDTLFWGFSSISSFSSSLVGTPGAR